MILMSFDLHKVSNFIFMTLLKVCAIEKTEHYIFLRWKQVNKNSFKEFLDYDPQKLQCEYCHF